MARAARRSALHDALSAGAHASDASARPRRRAEELQDHVEDIDCACDLSKVGGLGALLALLRSPHAQLRAAAAEVLGTAAQNNPKAQQQLLDGGVVAPLLPLAREDPDETVRLKGLLALGCACAASRQRVSRSRVLTCMLCRCAGLIRNFPPGEAAFNLGDGFGLLKARGTAPCLL